MAAALIVVDVQRDFCEGGSLAVKGGAATAAAISAYLDGHRADYAVVVATRDWHVSPGRHFAPREESPDYAETWPVHCVAGTEGALWHPQLRLPPDAVIVSKGEEAAAFSGFEGRDPGGATLAEILQVKGIDTVDVVGIATSFCVRATALDAVASGLRTRVIASLTADIDPAMTPLSLADLASGGVELSD